MSETPFINLQLIADRAGVSRATVSRALKNHPRISQSTIQRIKQIAAELGYRRDPHLADLMRHIRHRQSSLDRPVIALLLNQELPFEAPNVRGKSAMDGAWSRILESGYQPELFNIAELAKQGRSASRILWSRGIQGVIVCPFQNPGLLTDFDWNHFSIVAIGYSIHNPFHRAATNHYQGLLDTINNLRSRGYQRIGGVVRNHINQQTHHYYHAAYLLKQEELGCDTLLPALVIDVNKPEWLDGEFKAWFGKYHPDAIITVPGMLEMIHEWLKEKKINIPHEVGLTSLQVDDNDTLTSGIRQNTFQVGCAAVDLLMSLLQTNEKGIPHSARTVLVNGIWNEGQTTRPLIH